MKITPSPGTSTTAGFYQGRDESSRPTVSSNPPNSGANKPTALLDDPARNLGLPGAGNNITNSDAPINALEEAVKAVKSALDPVGNKLSFSIDKESNQIVVKVIDAKTNELIRQIPAEEVLKMERSLSSTKTGMLLQQRV